ncbi:MAG: ABC transporter permease [Limnochordales bacterium]
MSVPAPTWTETRSRWLARPLNPVLVAFIIAVLLFVVGELVSPGFAAYSQIINVLRVSSFLGIIAAGQTLVILSGGEGVDLSVGAIVTFGAIIASRVIDGQDAMVLWGLAQALAAGLALGAINGILIAYLKVPPLIMTLGMASVVKGLMLVYTKGQPSGRAAPIMVRLVSQETVFGIPGILWVWLALMLVLTFILRQTTFGRSLYAIGANRQAAYLSGIPVKRMVVAVYSLSGLLSALGGFFFLGYTQSVFLNLGDRYVLPSVAAVVVGGTSLAGGAGGYVGTVVGSIVLTVLQSVLVTLRMEEAGRQIVYGVVLLALLAAYGRQYRLRQ